MIKTSLIVFLTTTTFAAQAMEKQFTITEIIQLAQKNPHHQVFIETHFKLQLPDEKYLRDLKFTQLQAEIHNKTNTSDETSTVRDLVLKHLYLANYKKELAFYKKEQEECQQKINSLEETLNIKK